MEFYTAKPAKRTEFAVELAAIRLAKVLVGEKTEMFVFLGKNMPVILSSIFVVGKINQSRSSVSFSRFIIKIQESLGAT